MKKNIGFTAASVAAAAVLCAVCITGCAKKVRHPRALRIRHAPSVS